jgi:hypothetical protein
MDNVANRILGMTDAEILQLETPRVHSSDQVSLHGQITRNVRINAGLVVFSDDIDREREELHKNPRAFIKRRQQEASDRIRKRKDREEDQNGRLR